MNRLRFETVLEHQRTPLVVYNLESSMELKQLLTDADEKSMLAEAGDQKLPLQADVDKERAHFHYTYHTQTLGDYVNGSRDYMNGSIGKSPEIIYDAGLDWNFSRHVWRKRK